ncbi:GGDEF domain-containing protein [Sphingomonas sp. Mn802worker]|uniref:GGDEF domain-containing protein n=1 Tax=Sphingomonas sp. Mn802worker TaxID=629773 RepID=UPI00036D467A|nr:GGDEF domain-containing protein [Sphingomonas sp. Mn802worker]
MIDLSTLYALIIGTLLVSAALTLWESFGRWRRGPLLIWSTGWATLAIGCGIAAARTQVPGVYGWAASNLLIVSGYLLVLNGVAALDDRRYWRTSALLVMGLALGWMVEGATAHLSFWQYGAGFPILVASALTVFELIRNRALRRLRTRPLAILLPTMHTAIYVGRVFVLPLLAHADGAGVVALASKITMYEGVLYSVAMPMTLVSLVREEAQRHLLAASRTDYLTGLTNRQGLFEAAARLMRGDRAATLLAFDLDHFKAINDAHGHAAGDTVLQSFARVLREAAPDATLARLGGEEFAALLPDTNVAAARMLGEAIAARFAALDDHGADVLVSATVSTGLAQRGPDGDDLDALLRAADRALYVAKSLGRNRLVSASPLFNGAGVAPARAAPRRLVA